jgi:FixJ family two-component response regulator
MIAMTSTTAARRPSGSSGKRTPKVRGGKAVGPSRPGLVLVLDDDISLCRSLRRLLSANGFRVTTFERPSELIASEIPRSNACMVVDINLPEMNGVQTCETLKQAGRALPTILITARTDTAVHSLTAKSDAVAVLFKPFAEEELLEAIRRALALSAD